MTKKLLLIVAALFLLSCSPQNQNTDSNVPPEKNQLKKDFDRSNQKIELVVIFHENFKEVTEAHSKRMKGKGKEPDDIEKKGWAGWNKSEPFYCEIHAVPPKKIDDDYMLTLGHELTHCLYGSFHE